jgi:hypothetical protein
MRCPLNQVPAAPVSPELVAEFLRNAYISRPEDEADYLQDAIDDRAKRAWTGTLPMAAPHCECLLVRHHERLDPAVPPPFPYIGASKPSCFQCGIYLDAYNATPVRSHERFAVGRRSNDVVPCVLAAISDEFDSWMADHMVGAIRRLVTEILDEDIQKLELESRHFLSSYHDSSEYQKLKAIADGLRARRVPR